MDTPLSELLTADLAGLSDADLKRAASLLGEALATDRKHWQIVQYRPNQPAAWRIHQSMAKVIGVGAGNRAGKTDTCMAEWVPLATGIFPDGMEDLYRPKFRGPIAVRVVIQNFKTTLHSVALHKLQWWKWDGPKPIGGSRGHWGWVPKASLIDERWEKSWSEKLTTLTLVCRDPDDRSVVLGYSTVQFMSQDQDAPDFASGNFDIIHLDEPPSQAIWRECEARVMAVDGTLLLSMTWPDDPTIPVDWLFDEVYEKGLGDSPDVMWVELNTLANPHAETDSILAKSAGWDEATKLVRLSGQPLRFSNRIHPLFTDVEQRWCFACGKVEMAEVCPSCGSETEPFCHVRDFQHGAFWPVVFVIDPHPRKPHMFQWIAIDPNDDKWVVAEGEMDGDPGEVKAEVERIEELHGLDVKLRLIDPNMGRSPASAKRNVTWQDEFADAGLICDLADDSDVGRGRINEHLKPDPHTLAPRLHVHPRCKRFIYQFKRYVWSDWRRKDEKDVKQKPRPKYDDAPAMARYALSAEPEFAMLRQGAPIIRRPGRKGGY